MGLDVYLYTKAEALQNEAHEREETEFYGKDWELYDQKTEAEKDHFRENRQYSYTGSTDVPSRNVSHETLNNRRYLRSSYNGGGFDNIVPKFLGRDASYQWMFEEAIFIAQGEYAKWWTEEHIPGLTTAAQRAAKVAKDLRELETPLTVDTVAGNMFSGPPTATSQDALQWAKNEVEKAKTQKSSFFEGGWSSAMGNFYTLKSPLKVVAAVPGVDLFGTPAVHLIYESDREVLETYVESAVIAGEFAEEAIELIREDGSCYVSWSG